MSAPRDRYLVFVAALVLVPLTLSALPGSKSLKRVEQYPDGEQTNTLTSSFFGGMKEWNEEKYTFEAPFSKVWSAAKVTANEVTTHGGPTVTGADDVTARIHLGRMTQNDLIGMAYGSWLEELSIELKRESDSATAVMVLRKVVEKEITGNHAVRTQFSNGKVERWVLTRISDILEGKTDSTTATAGPTGKYTSARNSTDFILLKPDGTCHIQESPMSAPCRYEVDGTQVTLTFRGGMTRTTQLLGDTLSDQSGAVWSKGARPVSPQPSQPSANSSETLTNDDVIKMAAAKLPDSVIINKIKSSRSRFDLTTDGLIKLKAAGVHDAVLEAMTNRK